MKFCKTDCTFLGSIKMKIKGKKELPFLRRCNKYNTYLYYFSFNPNIVYKKDIISEPGCTEINKVNGKQ